MGNGTYKQAVRADEALTGQRWCTNCQSRQRVEGGAWFKRNSGMNQRWRCAGCIERARQRKALGQ